MKRTTVKRTTVKRTSCPGCKFTGSSWPTEKGVCFACGCSETKACAGGCSWTNKDERLCTACAKTLCPACASLPWARPTPRPDPDVGAAVVALMEQSVAEQRSAVAEQRSARALLEGALVGLEEQLAELEKRMGTLEQVVNVELQHVDDVVPKGATTGTTISGDRFHLWVSSSTRSPPCAELLLTSAHVTLSASDLRALGNELFAMARQLEPPVPPAKAAAR